MRITWEEHDLPDLGRAGGYKFQIADGQWSLGRVAAQAWADQVGGKRVGVGATSVMDQQYVIIIDAGLFIGPFENKNALLSWLNATQRVRMHH